MDAYKKYLPLVYRFLTIRNRSEKEVRDYLTKKSIDPEIAQQLIESLQRQKFLNDEVFARSWILSRSRFKPKGKYALEMELKGKGVAIEIIRKVISETSEDIPDELTQAKRLIEKRIQRFEGKPRQEVYQKIGGFLARRGFSWEISKKAIDSFYKERIQ